jgi:monofunctional biosynthetic peptidoglycan transglycosylase
MAFSKKVGSASKKSQTTPKTALSSAHKQHEAESRPTRLRGVWGRVLRWCLLGLFLFPVLYVGYRSAQVYWLREHRPETSAFRELRESQGVVTRAVHFVPLSEVSPHLVRAVLAGEDQHFWEHGGFDFDSLQKAALKNFEEGEVVIGGSTITQQLAKNLYLSEKRSYVRKGEEAVIALLLESMLTKRQILELYLNLIEWGEGIYGAEAAAKKYFKVGAKALGRDQAAHLAAMIPNPRTANNPLVNPRKHGRHKRFILRWMSSMKSEPATQE